MVKIQCSIKLIQQNQKLKFLIVKKGIKRSEDFKLKLSKFKTGKNLGCDNPNVKIILNLETGIFYFGANEVCNLYGFNVLTFRDKMRGDIKNNTQFIYT